MKTFWIHTYVRHDGERVPWKVSDRANGLEALKSDDRIEEVTAFTAEELADFETAIEEAVLQVARDYCEAIKTEDIKIGEICTGFDLLEEIEGEIAAWREKRLERKAFK